MLGDVSVGAGGAVGRAGCVAGIGNCTKVGGAAAFGSMPGPGGAASRTQRRSMYAFRPLARAAVATEVCGCRASSTTRDDVKADVFDYIERFYSPMRRHSTPGYVSPIEFEKSQRA